MSGRRRKFFKTSQTLDRAGGYTRHTTFVRGQLRKKFKRELVRLTDDPKVEMRWTLERFAKHIFVKHRLRLVGWPHGTKFGNLSENATSLNELIGLHRLWDRGDLRFERVGIEEAEAARANCRLAAPTPFVLPRGTRANEDERRDPGVVEFGMWRRRMSCMVTKSQREITWEDEEEAEHPLGREASSDLIDSFSSRGCGWDTTWRSPLTRCRASSHGGWYGYADAVAGGRWSGWSCKCDYALPMVRWQAHPRTGCGHAALASATTSWPCSAGKRYPSIAAARGDTRDTYIFSTLRGSMEVVSMCAGTRRSTMPDMRGGPCTLLQIVPRSAVDSALSTVSIILSLQRQ
ncbi:uncharacterized protein BXZ73DRAFT_80437 [Epithele typhae]|uniref:uncharacterized protein n=1 Tax=Epithele typhae TaxID=378194 RepID=UPI002008A56A|nr:uncharacterized protein BXZ73DRAFT_80433 [Epithele typhae]XP_047874072.1 uncharacterized protein BXZ73DRAFT_80437 [Epithele typhae]KAH9918893.1 hypothetical protein BXZ73DRAFT_80433 [Epithele typhae]KAH9918897.1 hypothetical protein BXZ73DRAFT_80437 [Epithele typhae]